ncbi:MAG: hypothetical protein O3A00_12630 [Planctomycetota bacterium]|nr:hypothetical protein [Planctomycetota bacterium]
MSQAKQVKSKIQKSKTKSAPESGERNVIAIQDFVRKIGGVEKAKLALTALNQLRKAA